MPRSSYYTRYLDRVAAQQAAAAETLAVETAKASHRRAPQTRGQKPKWRWVYFIHSPEAGLVKIGVSDDMQRRFAALSTGSPVPLILLGGIVTDCADELERELHETFDAWRRHGEWFVASPEILAMIAEAATSTQADMDVAWLEDVRGVQALVARH